MIRILRCSIYAAFCLWGKLKVIDDKKDHYVRYPFAYMKKRPVLRERAGEFEKDKIRYQKIYRQKM